MLTITNACSDYQLQSAVPPNVDYTSGLEHEGKGISVKPSVYQQCSLQLLLLQLLLQHFTPHWAVAPPGLVKSSIPPMLAQRLAFYMGKKKG